MATMKKPMMMAKAPAKGTFKPCKGCPNPAKCAKMGTCMAKAKK